MDGCRIYVVVVAVVVVVVVAVQAAELLGMGQGSLETFNAPRVGSFFI